MSIKIVSKTAADANAYAVAEAAAAIAYGISQDREAQAVLYGSMTSAGVGFPGFWTLPAEMAWRAERDLGTLWDVGERDFIDDTDHIDGSLCSKVVELGFPVIEVECDAMWAAVRPDINTK